MELGNHAFGVNQLHFTYTSSLCVRSLMLYTNQLFRITFIAFFGCVFFFLQKKHINFDINYKYNYIRVNLCY